MNYFLIAIVYVISQVSVGICIGRMFKRYYSQSAIGKADEEG